MTDLTTPENPLLSNLQQRLGYLQESLEQQDPQIKNHLKEIHKLLIGHEELVHLLSDEEIAKIMSAQQTVTNTTLVADVTKKKTSTAKKAAAISLGDL